MEGFDTVEEFIACERKKDTLWIVFHTVYNDIHALEVEPTEDMVKNYLNPDMVDNAARNEFLDYMKTNFSDVKLVKVRDLISHKFTDFPYLGSIAIDCDIDSSVAKALFEKYGSPYEEPDTNKAVLWTLGPSDAMERYRERERYRDIED